MKLYLFAAILTTINFFAQCYNCVIGESARWLPLLLGWGTLVITSWIEVIFNYER